MNYKELISTLLLVIGDACAIILSFFLAYIIRVNVLPNFLNLPSGFFPVTHFFKFFPVIIVYLFLFFYERIYTKRHTFWEEFLYIIRGLLIATVLIALFVYFSRAERKAARTIIALMFFISIITVPGIRLFLKWIMLKISIYSKSVAIICTGKGIKRVLESLNKSWYLGYKVKGIILPKGKKIKLKVNILGELNKLETIVKKEKIEGLILIEEDFSKNQINSIISRSEAIVNEIKIIPDALAIKFIGVQPEYLNELIMLSLPNNLFSPINKFLKRSFDIIFSLCALIILLPVFIIVSLIIKFTSPGPIFIIQKRLGKDGKLFNFIKFRSMFIDEKERLERYLKENPEARKEWKRYKKLKKYDPRVTKIGKIIRRFSIDETPQFLNVLKGDMSIVGPRPYLPREMESIGKYSSIIFKVKPGLTGLWQIRGRNELPFATRLKLDEFYVRNWSFFLDIMILIQTIGVILTGKGAY